MDDDDLLPRKGQVKLCDLGDMSIEELEDYIAALEVEIARVREDIAKKTRHRAGVEALFKR